MLYLLGYCLLMLAIVFAAEWKKEQNTERFLVANRSIKSWFGALSIAASWIYTRQNHLGRCRIYRGQHAQPIYGHFYLRRSMRPLLNNR